MGGRTHGLARSPEHKIWLGMNTRCRNPRRDSARLYIGKGIRVCERWRSFENFLADMGPRPSPKHSIDRIDPNGNYEPGNCRWATPAEQARNKDGVHVLTLNGRTMYVTEWEAELGLSRYTIYGRMKRGLPPEKCLHVGRLPGSGRRPWAKWRIAS